MSVTQTVFARLRKFLRVKLEVDSSTVDQDSALGKSPMGFDTAFIQSEFMLRLNDWFTDLIKPFPHVNWDEDTTLGDLTKSITDTSSIKTTGGYQKLVHNLAESALDDAAGEGAQDVPLQNRPNVRDGMNQSLERVLLRDINVDDLAGDRDTIIANITDRMMV